MGAQWSWPTAPERAQAATARCQPFLLHDASCFVGPHGEFDSVSGPEFGHEAGEVELDCAHADVELAGDLGVGSAACDGEEDFFFTIGEGFERLDRRGCGGGS